MTGSPSWKCPARRCGWSSGAGLDVVLVAAMALRAGCSWGSYSTSPVNSAERICPVPGGGGVGRHQALGLGGPHHYSPRTCPSAWRTPAARPRPPPAEQPVSPGQEPGRQQPGPDPARSPPPRPQHVATIGALPGGTRLDLGAWARCRLWRGAATGVPQFRGWNSGTPVGGGGPAGGGGGGPAWRSRALPADPVAPVAIRRARWEAVGEEGGPAAIGTAAPAANAAAGVGRL